jgi:hypothetical protein
MRRSKADPSIAGAGGTRDLDAKRAGAMVDLTLLVAAAAAGADAEIARGDATAR